MKRILVLNFFPAFTPPGSGGELRYFNLYMELSRRFDVTLLSPTHPQHEPEIITHSPSLREHRIPKGPIHAILHEEIARQGIGAEVSALVCALSARHPNAYHRAYLRLYPQADVIIHESPYMLEYDLLFGLDQKPRVYNSYNVETSLVEQVWRGEQAARYVRHIRSLERRLVSGCDLCFAVSEEERIEFVECFGADPAKVAIAPNGIHPGEYARRTGRSATDERPSALFFGSFHPPNVEAAAYILDELAIQCPGIDFVIAGSCMAGHCASPLPNVRVLGRVNDAVKQQLLSTTDVAINPMFSGSGTNLKVLEFLSAGIPLVSTPTGARGLDLLSGRHCVLAEKEDFAFALQVLVEQPQLQEELAERGKRYVESRFSWEAIAAEVGARLAGLEEGRGQLVRHSLLVLNDFEVHKPRGGGEVRINRLYSRLSNFYRVVLLCLNDRGLVDRQDITESFVQLSLPKTEKHLTEEQKCLWQGISSNDIVTSYQITNNELVIAAVRLLHQSCDAVVISHPYMIHVLDGLDEKPIIYESLNCEYELKKTILEGHPEYKRLIEAVRVCEENAIARSALIISVSQDDQPALQLFNNGHKPIHLIPNGVDVRANPWEGEGFAELKAMFHGRPVVVFIGSAHKPNVDSMSFITDQLAPLMPGCWFLIIGSVGDALGGQVPANVLLCGRVDEDHKNVLMRLADVAINPVTGGSGSNLKLAEYLAQRIPAVTTPFGARGYAINDGQEAIICELDDFDVQLSYLLINRSLRQSLAEHGYRYARQELDWAVLARRYDRVLREEIFGPSKKRLLVVTYRFTDPPLGGGEVYLLELLKRVAAMGEFAIDVATLDIKEINNQFQFSAQYSREVSATVPKNLPDTRVFKFKVDVLPDALKFHNAQTLFRRWMLEFREASLRHLSKYRYPLLLGGWYHPEHAQGRCAIWTSEEALIYVRGVEKLVICGHCPQRTRFTVLADQERLFDQTLEGEFALEVPFRGHTVARLQTDKCIGAVEDPRTLGVNLRSIEYQMGGTLHPLRLDHDYKAFLKHEHIEEYIEDLIHVATSRPDRFDTIFQATRGPVSREMEEWLDRHTADYDVVLGHSIPFATSVMAAQAAQKHGKPLLQLPHFHIDDEFYHWKSYYAALRQADTVISSPKAAEELFFAKIGCRCNYLPYGIDLNAEVQSVEERDFKKLYPSELPYVLVLGRKDRAKRYQLILEAVKNVNARGRVCNVLFIGRDEDGLAIPPGDAVYLGGQPDNVVRSALGRALCLITMSTSESFGIVILEAWAQRRPVIVSRACVAYTELVDDGLDGLVANQDDLSEKISWLLTHREEADRMGMNGYIKACRQFTWQVLADKLREILIESVKPYPPGVCSGHRGARQRGEIAPYPAIGSEFAQMDKKIRPCT
jgi:glycosyltransferase involved in cell wall biosynthesis